MSCGDTVSGASAETNTDVSRGDAGPVAAEAVSIRSLGRRVKSCGSLHPATMVAAMSAICTERRRGDGHCLHAHERATAPRIDRACDTADKRTDVVIWQLSSLVRRNG